MDAREKRKRVVANNRQIALLHQQSRGLLVEAQRLQFENRRLLGGEDEQRTPFMEWLRKLMRRKPR